MAKARFNPDQIRAALRAAQERGLRRAGLLIQKSVRAKLNLRSSNRGKTPSPPGEPPAKDTGTLARSVLVDYSRIGGFPRGVVVIGSKLKYARIHEYGGPVRSGDGVFLMPARPYFRPGILAAKNDARNAIRGEIMSAFRKLGGV